jgi:membrane peptidoglycan carboxypeptidase
VPCAGGPGAGPVAPAQHRVRLVSISVARKKPLRRRHRITLLVTTSLAAGLAAAGFALPVVGGLGLAARSSIDAFNRLPSRLNVPPLPLGSRILAANGAPLGEFYAQDRIPVTLSQVPTVMQRAIVAIEDSRFYSEPGLDLRGLLRAALHDATSNSGGLQGGSTLTQQYVKNILIETARTPAQRAAAQADTLSRKLHEARYAIAMAHHLSKQEILEGYLNIAYFGDGAYGIGSAARHYFDERVGRLTLPQAALLAGLVQDPSGYDPAIHPGLARWRRNVVLGRMAQLHDISRAAARQAMATPLRLHLTVPRDGCNRLAPYFCQYVVETVLADRAFGATPTARARLLDEGGLTIHTTLQPSVQRAAQQAVDQQVPWNGSIGTAEAVVQPGTGDIRAIALNAPYGPDAARRQNSVDWATDADRGASQGFQSGSTFKIFELAAALQEGLPLSLTYYAPVQMRLAGYTGCPALGTRFLVHNAANNESGRFNLLTGTWFSVNTFYAQLERRTGMCLPARIAGKLGVTQADGRPLQQYPSMVLGSNPVSPLDMADAYATFAASGRYCRPRAITLVVNRYGRRIRVGRPSCRQVLPPGLANTVTSVLRGVIDHPGATGTAAAIGRPAAGKTGTLNGYQAAWFIGYTPQLAAAVWMGYPRGGHLLQNVTIAGRFWPEMFGGDVPAMIWAQSMSAALAGKPVQDFPPPSGRYERGLTVAVPDVTGLSPAAAMAAINAAGLTPVLGRGIPSSVPRGEVAATIPGRGARVSLGGTVTIELSTGPRRHRPPPPASPSPRPTHSSRPPRRHHHHHKGPPAG